MRQATRSILVLSALLAVVLGQACGRKSSERTQGKSSAQSNESPPPKTRPTPAIKNWMANPTDSKGRQTFIRGKEARQVAKDEIELTGMLIETQTGTKKDMTIEAVRCIYDSRKRVAYSDGEIFLRTADGEFSVQGRGFRWVQDEAHLIISNEVQTTVRKRSLLRTAPLTSTEPPGLVTSDSVGKTNSAMIQILSDHLDYRSELALFQGHVQAIDGNGRLRCEKLAVHFGAGETNRLQRIEAEERVFLEHGASRATSDKATYLVEQDKAVVRLTGRATWRDAQREGTADTLVLDQVRNIVRAEGHARMKLPRQGLSQPGSLFTLSTTNTDMAPNTNAFVELSSDLLTLQLPPTNGPVQRIEAERNVVIVSSADNSRATGRKAVYDELSGTLELTGDPVFAGNDHLVKGEILVLDQTNRVFTARRNAFVRIPVAALGKSPLLARDPAVQKSTGAATNQFLEAFSDDFEYRTNRMDFRGNVRAQLIEDDLKRGELLCKDLKIGFGQRLEALQASGGVIARQFPWFRPDGQRVSKELSCQTLTAAMNADGHLHSLLAEQNVRGEQTVVHTNKSKPIFTRVATDRLTAGFAPQTNQVETIVAERNVTIERDGRTAHGDRAVFHGAGQVLELTGQPTALSPEGRVTEAEALLWDAAKQQLRVRGPFKSEWQRLRAKGTNTNASTPP